MTPLMSSLSTVFTQIFNIETSNTKANHFRIAFSDEKHSLWYN